MYFYGSTGTGALRSSRLSLTSLQGLEPYATHKHSVVETGKVHEYSIKQLDFLISGIDIDDGVSVA